MTKKLQNHEMSAGLDMHAKFHVDILIKSWSN
jgi:hypothetical protein